MVPMTFLIASQAFQPQGAIPKVYTCDGQDISPSITWQQLPTGTKSLALIMDDPDVHDPALPTNSSYVHWLVYNIPPAAGGLKENAEANGLPEGSKLGKNDENKARYQGPCPPTGQHHYYFKVYALDFILPDLKEPTKDQLEKAMEGHVIGKAELVGTYQRFR